MRSSTKTGTPQQVVRYLWRTVSSRCPAVGSGTLTAEINLLPFARHGIARRYCRDAPLLPARRVDLSGWW